MKINENSLRISVENPMLLRYSSLLFSPAKDLDITDFPDFGACLTPVKNPSKRNPGTPLKSNH